MKTNINIVTILILFFLLTFNLPLRAEDSAKLIEYIMCQEFDKAKELNTNGADVNNKAKNGKTALSLAQKKNNTEMIKLLKDLGAKE